MIVQDSKIHGQGLFAWKRIEAGEIIIVEFPLLIKPLSFIESQMQSKFWNQKQQEAYKSLYFDASSFIVFLKDKSFDFIKFHLNAINGMLYPLSSKINHHKISNVRLINKQIGKTNQSTILIVQAITYIDIGNEIVFNYFKLSQKHANEWECGIKCLNIPEPCSSYQLEMASFSLSKIVMMTQQQTQLQIYSSNSHFAAVEFEKNISEYIFHIKQVAQYFCPFEINTIFNYYPFKIITMPEEKRYLQEKYFAELIGPMMIQPFSVKQKERSKFMLGKIIHDEKIDKKSECIENMEDDYYCFGMEMQLNDELMFEMFEKTMIITPFEAIVQRKSMNKYVKSLFANQLLEQKELKYHMYHILCKIMDSLVYIKKSQTLGFLKSWNPNHRKWKVKIGLNHFVDCSNHELQLVGTEICQK